MNILVTGAGGFLGRYIVEQLIAEGHHNIYVTSLHTEKLENLNCLHNGLNIISNSEIFQYDYSNIDIVVNCAFPRLANGQEFAKGLDYINNLLVAIRPYINCGFIDISSQSVYSSSRQEAAKEDSVIELEERYETGKYCIEKLVDAYLYEHRRVHLRIASLIGPGFDQRIVNKFVKRVIDGEDISVVSGTQRFGFLDVRDCADAVCVVINKYENIRGEVNIFNIGAEVSYDILAIAQVVVEIGIELGYKKTVIKVAETVTYKNSDINSDKFYCSFGWVPKHVLRDTIHDIYYEMAHQFNTVR